LLAQLRQLQGHLSSFGLKLSSILAGSQALMGFGALAADSAAQFICFGIKHLIERVFVSTAY
jgi:hypothetical protein